jgi:acyl carrier protein
VVELSGGSLVPEAVDPAAALFDAGYVDSLSAVILTERVRLRYGVTVSEIDLVGRLHTLEALASFIAAQN